ncbi:hypothetical protein WMY93_004859 [Mugilogobius chulae]|uniref:Uncharacterized protein n=1 Tax=Mugilogobius chulae TaxID=88201 RepID=A0AAW0PTE2_9GOBI
MAPELNEISGLKDFVQNLNDQRKHVKSYVCSAYSVLALMMGARSGNAQQKTALYETLRLRGITQIADIESKMNKEIQSFEERLTEGVNKAKAECVKVLEEKIEKEIGSAFTKCRSVVKKYGEHTPQSGEQINLNTALSSFLTDKIDRRFRNSFPNSGKSGPFYGSISAFSLDCEQLSNNSDEVGLLLKFLKNEEEKVKTKLCREIRERKKQVYNILTETVKEKLTKGYEDAARQRKVKMMKAKFMEHVETRKDLMFDEAKSNMLKELIKLKEQRAGNGQSRPEVQVGGQQASQSSREQDDIMKTIHDDLERAMHVSLKKETTVPGKTLT